MPIDNQIVRNFINEALCPYGEQIRGVDLDSAALVQFWTDVVQPLVTNDGDTVVTGRTDLPTITGANMYSLIAEAVNKGQTFSNSVYTRFCVRPYQPNT